MKKKKYPRENEKEQRKPDMDWKTRPESIALDAM
jgi:hypothetical protein